MNEKILILGALSGALATFVMDLGASVGKRLHLTRGIDARWLGRWIEYLARGQWAHQDITRSNSLGSHEVRDALLCHYCIGAGLGVLYFSSLQHMGLASGTLWSAIAYGAATSVFAWFLLFPSLGFGWFGLKAPREYLLFRTSLLNHLIYGLGLAGVGALLQ